MRPGEDWWGLVNAPLVLEPGGFSDFCESFKSLKISGQESGQVWRTLDVVVVLGCTVDLRLSSASAINSPSYSTSVCATFVAQRKAGVS